MKTDSKAEQFYYDHFQLCLKWNLIERARLGPFSSDSSAGSEFFDMFETAMLENKHEFVQLLIEKRIELVHFVTEERLNTLCEQKNVGFCCANSCKQQ